MGSDQLELVVRGFLSNARCFPRFDVSLIFRAVDSGIGAAPAIAPIGIASVDQPAVKKDSVPGLKLNWDLYAEVHFVVIENMSLDRMIMVG